MLTIKPEGGICNRLFALHSAIRLGADIDQPVRMVWYINHALGCPFEYLFEMPPQISVYHEFRQIDQSIGQKLWTSIEKRLCWPPLRTTFSALQVEAMTQDHFDFTSLAQRRNTHLNAWVMFHAADHDFYPFQPIASLQQRIQHVTEGFGNTIGVHIRRSDHKPARDFSPTHLFEEQMQAEIERSEDVNFFLATDDPNEEAHLMQTFPGRIIQSPKRSLDRKQPAAIEDALVDLYALAATQKIIGSFTSTFSRAAGLLGHIDVEYIQSNPDAFAKKKW